MRFHSKFFCFPFLKWDINVSTELPLLCYPKSVLCQKYVLIKTRAIHDLLPHSQRDQVIILSTSPHPLKRNNNKEPLKIKKKHFSWKFCKALTRLWLPWKPRSWLKYIAYLGKVYIYVYIIPERFINLELYKDYKKSWLWNYSLELGLYCIGIICFVLFFFFFLKQIKSFLILFTRYF